MALMGTRSRHCTTAGVAALAADAWRFVPRSSACPRGQAMLLTDVLHTDIALLSLLPDPKAAHRCTP